MKLLCIEPGQTTIAIWPVARDMVKRAVERTNLSDFEQIERNVLEGRSLLWLVWDGERVNASVVTELTIAQGKKACTIVACAGDGRSRWMHLLGQIEDYARAENCVVVRVIGRQGWKRLLDGYDVRWSILEKDLIADGKFQPDHANIEQFAAMGRSTA